MRKITANFEIIDSCNKPYSGTIEILNPETLNVMQEIRNKIKSVYRIGVEQIVSVSNIVTDGFYKQQSES